ncbi:hypothetical protein D9M72_278720 [compost metagenome]
MLANVDQRIRGEHFAQPEVEGEVAVGRHQVGVVVDGRRVELVAAGRLDADEGQAETQAGDHHAAAAEHRVLLRFAPAFEHGALVGLGQARETGQVIGEREALSARAQVEAVQIVADATEQVVDKCCAVVRQTRDRIALVFQGAEDVQRGGRGVQAHTVADAAIAGGVVGQDQRDALVCIGLARQFAPAPPKFGHEVHAFYVRQVADHVALAALAAPGHALEADGAGDDAAVQLRQGNVHGQVARAEALWVFPPERFVVQGADGLQHRDVAAERAKAGGIGVGLGEAGGVDDQPGARGVQPVFHNLQTLGFLEAGNRDGQRIQPPAGQPLAESVDESGVRRLQVRSIEDQGGHGLVRPPFGLPVLQLRRPDARMVKGDTGQYLRLAPGVVTPQPATGQAIEELSRVVQSALAQVLPEAFGIFTRDVAEARQLRIGTVVAGHQDQRRPALGQRHQLFDAVAPVADAAVHRDEDDLGVQQHLVDIEVHRGVVLQLHGVGQAQARVVRRQFACGFCQQGQMRIAAAEDHQLGGRLGQVGDAIVGDETAGLGAQQVHGGTPHLVGASLLAKRLPRFASKLAPTFRPARSSAHW